MSKFAMPGSSLATNAFRLKCRDALAWGVLLVVVIAALEWMTGNEFSLASFYLFPILLVAWNCGRVWGSALALAAVGAQVAQALLQGSMHFKPVHPYIALANAGLEYVIAVWLIGMLRRLFELERQNARIDALTGARNRKGLHEALASEIARHQRNGRTFCLAYIDCDDFKHVNDTRGHAEGDRVLRATATIANETLRRSDTIGRIGGDEFAIILPDTGQRDALIVVDKLQHKLHTVARREQWQINFSIGVAVFATAPDSALLAMNFADRLMYAAKRIGKGVTVWNAYGDAHAVPTVWQVRTVSG
jgi:diguanylate cyclase (GGDEF)-like protein